MTQDLGKPLDAQTQVSVDVATCLRAAALAAYGLLDQEICDTLIITDTQLAVAKLTVEYKEQFAEKTQERIAQQIDISTGWDGVEQAAVAKVLSALKHTEDPNYALAAARVSNQAKRRTGTGAAARVIDPSRAGSVMHITLNQKYVTNVQNNGLNVDAQPSRETKVIEHKRVDMPNVKVVKDLLAPVRPLLQKMREHSISDEMNSLGFDQAGKLDDHS